MLVPWEEHGTPAFLSHACCSCDTCHAGPSVDWNIPELVCFILKHVAASISAMLALDVTGTWNMQSNKLKLNTEKTEMMPVEPVHILSLIHI